MLYLYIGTVKFVYKTFPGRATKLQKFNDEWTETDTERKRNFAKGNLHLKVGFLLED